jgi:hypothetical protein
MEMNAIFMLMNLGLAGFNLWLYNSNGKAPMNMFASGFSSCAAVYFLIQLVV